jgi:hypothetical protein
VLRLDGRDVVLDVTLVTRVSLAVDLVDKYTNERAVGRTRVFVKEVSQEGRKNPSGYFLFLNIPDGVYTISVTSEHYRDEERVLSLPSSFPENPLVTVFLEPRPSYPFPPGATLIRGMVRDPTDKPLAEARVEIVGKNIENRSAENGEFVLYFGALKETDIIRVNGKSFVKGNGDQMITVRANHPNYGTLSATTEVQEGTAASVMMAY